MKVDHHGKMQGDYWDAKIWREIGRSKMQTQFSHR
jgi:hypothetical protein